MNTKNINILIEEFFNDLPECRLPFPEYYPHMSCDCWKVLNPYTLYAQDKIVLFPVDNNFAEAVEKSSTLLRIQKAKFEENPKEVAHFIPSLTYKN